MIERWIGIPYEKLNCWDLVRALYIEELGLDLGEPETQIEGIRNGEWFHVEPCEAKRYDVLVFHDIGGDPHVGVVLDECRFLHTLDGINSSLGDYKGYLWKHRIRNIYRRSLK